MFFNIVNRRGIRIAIKKNQDLTGDNIPDIMIKKTGIPGNRYLFIGKEDGTFTKTVEKRDGNRHYVKYFVSDEKDIYFFDGKNYILSPREK